MRRRYAGWWPVIRVTGTKNGGRHELLLVELENVSDEGAGEFGEYSVRFVVDTGEGFATYQRAVRGFPRKKYNALGLLRLALESLDEKELTLDADPDARRSPDLARRLPRAR